MDVTGTQKHLNSILKATVFGAALTLTSLGPLSAFAETGTEVVLTDADRAEFAAWLKDFRKQARATGISRKTLDDALTDIEPNADVLRLNDFQPEHSRAVWEYLDGAVSDARITKGKALLQENAEILARVEADFGVPPRYLVAIWGMETSFGAFTGGFNAIEALATLGYKGKRATFGRTQLMAALQIVDNGDKAARDMTGSWAGAMGQTQFIPTTFLTYAVDYDDDGHRDIWSNLPDVFASTANYLEKSGWERDRSWGREVTLPQGFDYALADRNKQKTLTEWSAYGVKLSNGSDIPALADRSAAIIAPAGHQGPAFMIFDNFRAILRYNNSTSYALAVSLLADQLIDGEKVHKAWPRHERALSRPERLELQQRLTDLGFDTQGVDGILGANTRKALRAYQSTMGQIPDGFATGTLLEEIRAQTAPQDQTSPANAAAQE